MYRDHLFETLLTVSEPLLWGLVINLNLKNLQSWIITFPRPKEINGEKLFSVFLLKRMAVEIFCEMGKLGDLTIQEKWGIVCRYFWYTDPSTGKLQKGALNSILSEVNRGKSTVMRTMKEFREICNQQETLTPDLNVTFGHRTGRPSELTEELKAD